MSQFDIGLVTVSGLVLVFGFTAHIIRSRSFVSEPMLAMVLGVLLGPTGLGLLDMGQWGLPQEKLITEAARLTLGLGLMAVALRLPKSYLRRQWRSLMVLLGFIMPVMCLAGAVLLMAVLGLPFWTAFLVGAVIAPTDPIVASAIVTGSLVEEIIPERVRDLISAESGANDGLAYPLVVLPFLVLNHEPMETLSRWLLHSLLLDVGLAAAMGWVLGWGAGHLLDWHTRGWDSERLPFLAYSIALSMLILGFTGLFDINSIFAVFTGGLAFSRHVEQDERMRRWRVQEAISQFFTMPAFTLLGLAIPWQGWHELGWKGMLLTVLILFLRRLPAMLLLAPILWRILPDPQLRTRRDTLFAGWFGPVGIAAMYYASHVYGLTGDTDVWNIASLVICASVLLHGVTATWFIKLYGRHGAIGAADSGP